MTDTLTLNEFGLSAEERERAKLPQAPKPEERGSIEACAVCGKPIEQDGFCATTGPYFERWLCDQHVHEFRGQAQAPQVRVNRSMNYDDVQLAIAQTKGALANLGFISKIEAMDSSGASRGFELALTFKQSRPIFAALLKVLELKLTAYPPPPPPIVEAEPEPE